MSDIYNLKHIDECSLEELQEELDDVVDYFMKMNIKDKEEPATQEDIGLCFIVMRKAINILIQDRV